MIKPSVDGTIQSLLHHYLGELESHFKADFITYFGPMIDGYESQFMSVVEELSEDPKKKNKLYVCLTTQGGSATAVERLVNIIRSHYKEVFFLVPDHAYSAGTIFCMSGDGILMDYYSVLGPIDPQVPNKDGKFVPALGYLDKVAELIKKAETGEITDAEIILLRDLDLAELRAYEQAKELTIDLLKKWLVKYKFKNWKTHQSNPKLKGKRVTKDEKIKRAEEIADALSDNKKWLSHGRPINAETLTNDLRLKIIDYTDDKETRELVRQYYYLLTDFVHKQKHIIFTHTRNFI